MSSAGALARGDFETGFFIPPPYGGGTDPDLEMETKHSQYHLREEVGSGGSLRINVVC
jgi:hypothetical protein